VKKLLQKAIRWKALLDSGKVSDQAEIARYEGLSRARVTQIMSLLRLSPEIQDTILNLPKTNRQHSIITERSLRPIAQLENQRQQVEAFKKLVKQS
jgi:ParB-like chromosome segregation protein Spo0J